MCGVDGGEYQWMEGEASGRRRWMVERYGGDDDDKRK